MTFDNIVFTPPAGWSVEQGTDGVMLVPADTRGNEALRVWLMPGRRSTASLQQEFEQTWAEVRSAFRAEQLLTVNSKPFELKQPGHSPRGWDYLQGEGGLRIAGSQWNIDVYVIKAGDRLERIAVLSRDFRDNSGVMLTTKHNPRYTRALRQLIFTLQFANLPSVAIPPAGLRGDPIVGVWRGIAMSFGSLKPHFAIFFDNGTAFFGPGFPVDGLLGIDPSVEEPGSPRYWGRYTLQNGMGSITMPYGSIPVALKGADLTLRTNNTDHRFGRLPMLEARHIEGTWCLSGGQCLRFTNAGRFEDDGAARIVEHSTYAFPETPGRGQGQYEVRDFTLILRYDGGPELRIALLALAGTPTAPQMLLSFNIDVLTRR